MSSHPFKIALWFGVPMLALAVFLTLSGNKAMSNLATGFFTPVIAFEFINNAAEVRQFFNVPDANAYRIDFMFVNMVDYAFMFFYSAFLGFTVLGVIKETGLKLLYLALALSLMICLADMFENITMANIVTLHFQNESISASYFGNLSFFTWLKWGGIAAIIFMCSGYFIQKKFLSKAIAVLGIANFFLAIAAFIHRSVLNEIMSALVALLFLLLFIHHISFKPSPEPPSIQ